MSFNKKNIVFIFCPNIQTHLIRKWLNENDFFIEKEKTFFDKKFYQIIVAKQKKIIITITREKYLYFGQNNKQLHEKSTFVLAKK